MGPGHDRSESSPDQPAWNRLTNSFPIKFAPWAIYQTWIGSERQFLNAKKQKKKKNSNTESERWRDVPHRRTQYVRMEVLSGIGEENDSALPHKSNCNCKYRIAIENDRLEKGAVESRSNRLFDFPARAPLPKDGDVAKHQRGSQVLEPAHVALA